MLLNLLVASLVLFFVWIIQEIMGKTVPKATYFKKNNICIWDLISPHSKCNWDYQNLSGGS